MENLDLKINFLKNVFGKAAQMLQPDAEPLFGKMNPHQMAEHMATYVRLAYGVPKIDQAAYTQEVTDKMRQFLQSEKHFKPNTPNPLLPDTPPIPQSANYQLALEDLDRAINEFFDFFEQQPQAQIFNPFFGSLNFELSVQLLYKHALHHLRQFGYSAEQLSWFV